MRLRRVLSAVLTVLLAMLGVALVATPASAGSLSIPPTGDTFVSSLSATGNFSTSATMRANGTPEKTSLLDFNVTGIPSGATNVVPKLVLHGVGGTTQTVTVQNITGTWDPATVTYNTKPVLGSTVYSGTIGSGTTLEVPLTFTTNGGRDWAITATGTADAVIATSEDPNASLRPELVITYTDPVTNTAPTVSGGANQTVATPPASVSLDGTVTDDGLPGATTTTWSKVSGPGTVTFGNASAVDTTAGFSGPGVYVLRLTANDGALSTSDDVQVTVEAPLLYGTAGQGNPQTSDCTINVASGGNLNTAVTNASAGAVICAAASNYSTTTLTINKAVTVRANGVVTIKNAVVSGGGTLDGFTVVGGTYDNPSTGVLFSGNSNKITNNLINGHGLVRGVYCTSCGSGTVIDHNTITKISHYGIQTGSSANGLIIEWNNIYDLYDDVDGLMDVDAMRPFGTDLIIRNNYMHDLNAQRSILGTDSDRPHLDCIQHYQNTGGTLESVNLLVENNFCVRVTGIFIISKNNLSATQDMRGLTVRGNVTETYGNAELVISGVPNLTVENNSFFGATTTGPVIAVENGDGGAQMTNARIQNNVLVSGVSNNPGIGNKGGGAVASGIITVNRDNVYWVDTDLAAHDAAWTQANPSPYNDPIVENDFTLYKAWSQEGGTLIDQGTTLLTTGFTTDVEGSTRVQGSAVDIGAYELG